jgi:hypothetical protein
MVSIGLRLAILKPERDRPIASKLACLGRTVTRNGHFEHEGRAFAGLGLGGEGAAVGAGDALGEVEAEAEAG